ncbi:MAG: hypothetical protein OXU66_06105 [Gammaproteobacteria bacterium]|nr:hypothetical protein [Gammaproteobacteria bacterium]MDD9895976.1 hypothetical protein [Gammaproteobacteria bacterium]MDD9958498.1 hypothetical protein [Gammaproteobacteria bacterium]
MKSTTLKLSLLIFTLCGYLAAGAWAGAEEAEGYEEASNREISTNAAMEYNARDSAGSSLAD